MTSVAAKVVFKRAKSRTCQLDNYAQQNKSLMSSQEFPRDFSEQLSQRLMPPIDAAVRAAPYRSRDLIRVIRRVTAVLL